MFESGNQLKGYVQREIKKTGMNSNYGFNYYFTRIFLEKLYEREKMKLVLKGSYSQFVNIGKIERPITDIDIVTYDKIEYANELMDDIVNDSKGVKFKVLNKFVTTNATLNYKILCDFDGKTGRISLDLKREDGVVFTNKNMPTLFSEDIPFVTNTISIEEHLAAKLYVLFLHLHLHVRLSREFRRFKDIFDIHTILGSSVVDENLVMELLKKKIREDEFLRGYKLDGMLLGTDFVTQNMNEWESDRKKYNYLTDTTFEEAVEKTTEFIDKIM